MQGSLRTTAWLCGLGVAFDLAVNQQAPGASAALYIAGLAAAVVLTLPRSHERSALCAAAVTFASFVAFRDDEGLVMIDLVVAAGLLGVAATGQGVIRLGVRSIISRAGTLMRSAIEAPVFFLQPLFARVGRTRLRNARPVLRATVIALPILVVFTALLASADAVFASVVLPRFPRLRLGSLAGHVALSGVGTFVCAALWAAAGKPRQPEEPAVSPPPMFGAAEWGAVLGGMALLFTVFVGVQFAYLFGGAHRVEVTRGLTYAEYARSGFFQLLFAAGLSALVVLGAWDLGRRDSPRRARTFRWLTVTVVVLCGIMLISAAKRLALYQRAFGWTLDRFTAGLAIAWIAAVLVLLVALLLAGRREHLVAGITAAALAVLLAANLIGPSEFVATRNIARFERTGKLDVPYLASVAGAGAIPPLIDAMPRLPTDPDLNDYLCQLQAQIEEQGWRSWNLARVRARDAVIRSGIPCPLRFTASG